MKNTSGEMHDFYVGIVYPLIFLIISGLVWRLVLSKLCTKIGILRRTLHGTITLVMYLLQWSVSNPHVGSAVPLSPSMDLYLFLAGGYYQLAVNRRATPGEIVYSVVMVLSILDFLSYRKGGDVAVCYIFLTVFPDLVISFILRFTNYVAVAAVMDCVLHILCRVILFGDLLIICILEKKLTSTIKINMLILHFFSYSVIPSAISENFCREIGKKIREYRRAIPPKVLRRR